METIKRKVDIHLSGGLRSDLLEENSFSLWPISNINGFTVTNVPEGKHINLIKSFGIRWIGVDEVSIFDGMTNRLWSTFTYGHVKIPYTELTFSEPSSFWSAISFSLRKTGDHEAAELARKISFELNAAGMRLRDISDSYGIQLEHACRKGMNENRRFSNLEIHNLILACHSFLGEMCALRDYLASFIAKTILNVGSLQYMNSLVKKINGQKLNHPIAISIINSTDRDGKNPWLWHLSEYRNHITHVAPIHHFSDKTMMKVYCLKNPYDVDLKRVSFEIPYNVQDRGSESPMCDALDRFHELMVFMEAFAVDTAILSGIQPDVPQFTDKEIISIKKVGISDK